VAITCPQCGATSHHPVDEQEGYCGRCHDWTSPAVNPPIDLWWKRWERDGVICWQRNEPDIDQIRLVLRDSTGHDEFGTLTSVSAVTAAEREGLLDELADSLLARYQLPPLGDRNQGLRQGR
jgi:hypothetical protein